MFYDVERKLSFVHIPRTGGSALKSFCRSQRTTSVNVTKSVSLESMLKDHTPFNKWKPPLVDKFSPITLVRSPYTRAVSLFYHSYTMAKTFKTPLPTMTLEEFYSNAPQIEKKLFGGFSMLSPQVDFFLTDRKVSRGVTLFKTETDFDYVCELFGVVNTGEQINKSTPNTLKELTPSEKATIENFFKKDFDYFGDYYDT